VGISNDGDPYNQFYFAVQDTRIPPLALPIQRRPRWQATLMRHATRPMKLESSACRGAKDRVEDFLSRRYRAPVMVTETA
jgi:hypothetical protein